jgi:hypothetical protein
MGASSADMGKVLPECHLNAFQYRKVEAQEALGFPQESLLQCKSKLRPRLGPMQSPGVRAGGVRETPAPYGASSGRSRKCRVAPRLANYKSQ